VKNEKLNRNSLGCRKFATCGGNTYLIKPQVTNLRHEGKRKVNSNIIMKKTLYLVFFILLSLILISCKTFDTVECFTHPNGKGNISLFSKPNANNFSTYLQSDEEAGWIVSIKKQHKDFFLIELPKESQVYDKKMWIKAGDVGVVVQNYDSIGIPIYMSLEDISILNCRYIYESIIGKIYDITKNYILIEITLNDGNVTKAWVEKKYLCGNPYTTCN
jgi:hypothetical protein